jgi:hypothetical protein
MTAYQTTSVPSHKSQEGIRKILLAHDVRGVQFSEDFETRQVGVRFAKELNGNMRTVSVSMTIPEPPKPKRTRKRAVRYVRGRMVYDKTPTEKREQMARATYRALHYWLKSQFEAVDFGLLSFEDVFLSHFEWMINGQPVTTGRLMQPYLDRPALMPPDVGQIIDGEVRE